MRREVENSLRSLLLEFLVYVVLVAGYFFLVLHFLGGWLYRLFQTERSFYAAMALLLIVGQGFLLEALTRLLLNWIKSRREDE